MPGLAPPDDSADNLQRRAADAERWNFLFGDALNAHRDGLGLPPIANARDHVVTDRPWPAADEVLGPWPGPGGVVRTGAWTVPDDRPLPAEVEEFLEAGEPPVYFGFGSAPAAEGLCAAAVEAARAVGRRAIVSRGWAGPTPGGVPCPSARRTTRPCSPRVAAVVHHGGAGPRRPPRGRACRRSSCRTLRRALLPAVVDRAAALAPTVRADGALVAAQLPTGLAQSS